MGFARKVADRVVFMDGGRIVEEGRPAEVSTHRGIRGLEVFSKPFCPDVRLRDRGNHHAQAPYPIGFQSFSGRCCSSTLREASLSTTGEH